MNTCWYLGKKDPCACIPAFCTKTDPSKGVFSTKAECLNACEGGNKNITCYDCLTGCRELTVQAKTCQDVGKYSTKDECRNSKDCGPRDCWKEVKKDPCGCSPFRCTEWDPRRGLFKSEKECLDACAGGEKAISCYDCESGTCYKVNVYSKSCEDAGKYSTFDECSKECSVTPPTPPTPPSPPSPPSPPNKKGDETIWIIVGISVGLLVLLIVIGIIIYVIWRKKRSE